MKKSNDGICHIKLTRRDVCAMCQTSAERLKKLEAIAEAAKFVTRNYHPTAGAIEKLHTKLLALESE